MLNKAEYMRGDFFDDINGQRTGTATAYNNWAIGWQHWLSPQVELRPEVAWYHALDIPALIMEPNIPSRSSRGTDRGKKSEPCHGVHEHCPPWPSLARAIGHSHPASR
jgi:hypothetical protein